MHNPLISVQVWPTDKIPSWLGEITHGLSQMIIACFLVHRFSCCRRETLHLATGDAHFQLHILYSVRNPPELCPQSAAMVHRLPLHASEEKRPFRLWHPVHAQDAAV
ncbi:hypothetical protein ABBQ38_004244 [Trebouxia sp. C0009 RCD-2024]